MYCVARQNKLETPRDKDEVNKREIVYYEPLKRALKTTSIYGYRCDERLKTNVGKSTRLRV